MEEYIRVYVCFFDLQKKQFKKPHIQLKLLWFKAVSDM